MTIFSSTAKIHHATKAKADKLASMLAGEYPALSLVPQEDENNGKIIGFETWHDIPHPEDDGETRQQTLLLATKKVPELADIFAACEDNDLDPEEIDAPAKPSGSVVDEAYRSRYKEASSTGRSNGDALAEWLAKETIGADNKTDFTALEAIFAANGLDLTAKWAKVGGSNGWQGRYRMNGRQVLEKTVAKSGHVFDGQGNQCELDPEFIAAIRNKHAKWLTKEEKRDAAAVAVAEAAAGKETE